MQMSNALRVMPSKLSYLCCHFLAHTYNFLPRIFLAGKKLMQIALGRSAADEAKAGLHKLSKVPHQIFFRQWCPAPLIRGFDLINFSVCILVPSR
jgi:hypothetical protein